MPLQTGNLVAGLVGGFLGAAMVAMAVVMVVFRKRIAARCGRGPTRSVVADDEDEDAEKKVAAVGTRQSKSSPTVAGSKSRMLLSVPFL